MQCSPESASNLLSRSGSSRLGLRFDAKTLRSWQWEERWNSQQVSQTELIWLITCSMDQNDCLSPARNLREDILSICIHAPLLDTVNLEFVNFIFEIVKDPFIPEDSTMNPDQSLKCCCCIFTVFYWLWWNLISSMSQGTSSESSFHYCEPQLPFLQRFWRGEKVRNFD